MRKKVVKRRVTGAIKARRLRKILAAKGLRLVHGYTVIKRKRRK